MATKYLYVNDMEDSGRVTSDGNQLRVDMGGLDYDSVKIASICFNTLIVNRVGPSVWRLLGTEGHSTNMQSGAVVSIMNVIMETNATPARTVTGTVVNTTELRAYVNDPIIPAPDPEPLAPTDEQIVAAVAASQAGQTVEASNILYYYTSSGINPCVHSLHSRQRLTFELSESDGTAIDIDDISNLCILLELN